MTTWGQPMIERDTEITNLRSALAKCLHQLHDYFGLTEAEIKVALDAAQSDPNWSCYDEKKWTASAYPPNPSTK